MNAGKKHLLVAGLGNSLLTDDGVGVHAVRLLENHPRFSRKSNVIVAEVGTAVLDAFHLLEWADQILAIDAMQAGHPPGTIYFLPGNSVDDPGVRNGMHELTLLGAMNLLPPGPKPPVSVLGIEPEIIDYGLNLTPAIQAVLPEVAERILSMIHDWEQNPETLRTIPKTFVAAPAAP